MYKKISEELVNFIKNSPTAFHAIDNISKRLKENGYEELLEGKCWDVKPGGKYFVTRNNSSIIALNIGTKLDNYSFNVAASHSDYTTISTASMTTTGIISSRCEDDARIPKAAPGF